MKIAFYGDSITQDDDGLYGVKGYPTYLKESLGIEYDNFGIRGETLPQILRRINAEEDLSTYDYVFILGGTNDWLQGHEIIPGFWSVTKSSLIKSIMRIKNNWPQVNVVVMHPPKGWIKNKMIPFNKMYEDAAIDTASKYIDLYHLEGLQDINIFTDNLEIDGWAVHPNSDGHKLIAQEIQSRIFS